MCGRYALALVSFPCPPSQPALESNTSQRPSEVRQQLQDSQMPVEEAPEDDNVRQSYNFAPGYHGLVYRADGPDHGNKQDDKDESEDVQKESHDATAETKYKLQSMQWGIFNPPES